MVAHYRETGWIGVSVEWVESGTQMEVQDVVPEGPAFQAGIQIGEIKTGDESPVIVGDNATITYAGVAHPSQET
jgi:S1-C subfamily serine protease